MLLFSITLDCHDRSHTFLQSTRSPQTPDIDTWRDSTESSSSQDSIAFTRPPVNWQKRTRIATQTQTLVKTDTSTENLESASGTKLTSSKLLRPIISLSAQLYLLHVDHLFGFPGDRCPLYPKDPRLSSNDTLDRGSHPHKSHPSPPKSMTLLDTEDDNQGNSAVVDMEIPDDARERLKILISTANSASETMTPKESKLSRCLFG